MLSFFVYIICALFGYLLGAVNFSYLIARKLRGIDIRQHGSGNAGATNALRVLGKGPAIAVLLLDGLKGVAAAAVVSGLFAGTPHTAIIAGLAAIIGHNWPVYYGFRGGKGVATTIGVMAYVAFVPALIAGALTIAIIALTRYVSLGSLAFMVFALVASYAGAQPPAVLWAGWIVLALSVYRHRQNIARLLRGKERKLGQPKEQGGDMDA